MLGDRFFVDTLYVLRKNLWKLNSIKRRLKTDTLIDGCIVWNAHNTVFGSKRSAYGSHSGHLNLTRSPAIAEGPRDAGVPVEIW